MGLCYDGLLKYMIRGFVDFGSQGPFCNNNHKTLKYED